ncbi:MAG TPA: putative metal-dependent hydrolase [Bacteroidia bacterium]|nr:putative metal-dependent hydrolase [Bacteroidia bacterium]HNQ00113.1 putative metal-dependent hydrolase [Bacteroidia bacterium]
MADNLDDQLRYPIGKYIKPTVTSIQDVKQFIHRIDHVPFAYREAVNGLSDIQLDTPYRDGGWTVRQVVHHVVDSHMNAYCRFKLGMTEVLPAIRPYNEKAWAQTEDGMHGAPELSLDLLKMLHFRWVFFLRSLKNEDWDRKIFHPEAKTEFTLFQLLAMYAWHGDHHLAQIISLKKRNGWGK